MLSQVIGGNFHPTLRHGLISWGILLFSITALQSGHDFDYAIAIHNAVCCPCAAVFVFIILTQDPIISRLQIYNRWSCRCLCHTQQREYDQLHRCKASIPLHLHPHVQKDYVDMVNVLNPCGVFIDVYLQSSFKTF